MPLEQILSESQRTASGAAVQRAAEEGARLGAAAAADAEKRRGELIEEARRIAEHERQRLLVQARGRSLHRSAAERTRRSSEVPGDSRRQLATVREAGAAAERLKELARAAAEIVSAMARDDTGPGGELRRALVVVDPRELGLVPSAGERERT